MKFFTILFLASFSIFILLLSFTISNDFSQDLGRHLLLGKIIVNTHWVPNTNLLSYTYPHFPFVNHHWLSEVVFYGLVQSLGLWSLQFLKIALSLFALICASFLGWKLRKSLVVGALVALFFAPLYFWRVNIRPELFGYVFFSVMLLFLFLFSQKKWVSFAVVAILLFWVNLHSTWLFGYALALLISLRKKSWKLAFASTLILLVNPNGIRGPLFPLTVLTNYGYTIAENMTALFMVQVVGARQYWYVLIAVIVGVLGSIGLILRRRYWEAIVLGLFTIATFSQNRHGAFLCLSGIALLPQAVPQKVDAYAQKPLFLFLVSSLLLFVSFFIPTNQFYEYFSVDKQFGIAVYDQYNTFGRWAKSNLVGKRLFNTFDIGGHLAYSLYPSNKVYVDNRPEAYPAASFKGEYIPIQNDVKARDAFFKQRNINTVVMNHTDGTNWGKAFLGTMLADSHWHITYLDGYAVVFEKGKRRSSNDAIIREAIVKATRENELQNLYIVATYAQNEDLRNAVTEKLQKMYPGGCSAAKIQIFEALQNKDAFNVEKSKALRRAHWWCF